MSLSRGLLSMLQLSDSAFPSGAFGFSNGLESLTRDGWVVEARDLEAILHDQILPRWFDFDRVYIALAHGAAGDATRLQGLDRDCEARNVTAPLRDASLSVGRGTLASHARRGTPTSGAWLEAIADGTRLGHAPVVQGALGHASGLDLLQTEAGALHGLLSGFVGAAVRLGKLGALSAQPILARAADAASAALDDPAADVPTSFAPLIEISASRAATSSARLFAN